MLVGIENKIYVYGRLIRLPFGLYKIKSVFGEHFMSEIADPFSTRDIKVKIWTGEEPLIPCFSEEFNSLIMARKMHRLKLPPDCEEITAEIELIENHSYKLGLHGYFTYNKEHQACFTPADQSIPTKPLVKHELLQPYINELVTICTIRGARITGKLTHGHEMRRQGNKNINYKDLIIHKKDGNIFGITSFLRSQHVITSEKPHTVWIK